MFGFSGLESGLLPGLLLGWILASWGLLGWTLASARFLLTGASWAGLWLSALLGSGFGFWLLGGSEAGFCRICVFVGTSYGLVFPFGLDSATSLSCKIYEANHKDHWKSYCWRIMYKHNRPASLASTAAARPEHERSALFLPKHERLGPPTRPRGRPHEA